MIEEWDLSTDMTGPDYASILQEARAVIEDDTLSDSQKVNVLYHLIELSF